LEFLAIAIMQEEKVKGIQIGKELVKLSLFVDDMILQLKDLRKPTSKLLDTINSFSKLARYKINLQKSVAFLYNSNEQFEKEYGRTILLTATSKNIKYQEINLTRDENDQCKEIYKPLKKEIEKDYRRWKDLPWSWIDRISIVKIAILPKAIYMFNTILIKLIKFNHKVR
jgi:hypothetical protein